VENYDMTILSEQQNKYQKSNTLLKTAIKDTIYQIPEELKDLPTWICWKWGKDHAKLPISPETLQPINHQQDVVCASFEVAVCSLGRNEAVSGVGLSFRRHHNLLWIDLDHAVDMDDPDRSIKFWASELLEDLNSYTEWSISQEGFHVCCRIPTAMDDYYLPPGGRRAGIEVYTDKRYFIMTGMNYGARKPIRTLSLDEIRKIYGLVGCQTGPEALLHGKARGNGGADDMSASGASLPVVVDDSRGLPRVIEALCANDALFKKTWERRRRLPSDSEYCMAICRTMLEAECSDQDIVDAMVGWRKFYGSKPKPDSWYLRNIANSREGRTKTLDKKQAKEGKKQAKEEEKHNDERVDDLAQKIEESSVTPIAAVNELFGLTDEIVKIARVQVRKDSSQIFVCTKDQREPVGSVLTMSSQARWRNTITLMTKIRPPRLSAEKWDMVAMVIIAQAVVDEADEDENEAQKISMEYVEQLRADTIMHEREWGDAESYRGRRFSQHKDFVDHDGIHYVNPTRVSEELKRRFGNIFTPKFVNTVLERMGYYEKTKRAKAEWKCEPKVKRYFWNEGPHN
jgi:hypothetical protein